MEHLIGIVSLAVGLLTAAGVLLAVARSAAKGELERNPMVGIRTRTTLSSDAAWRAGHRAAAPWLTRAAQTALVAGIVSGVIAVVQAVTGAGGAAVLAVPGAGWILFLLLVVVAVRRADTAGRAATEGA
ncbi:SdpI family protein [Marinactinospora thermotolerans]|uniref:SdpI/YhfL protein family protein n=1 Tax=Marinactinospora thermotolerans DSM 45154 TaxID=1122192 RepID=A0A1T4T6R6_9ACTN|nr:SdpI family protein [Marinactinospora thermotolerans]SKA36174.1 SdpI/YhfL protein family protein [Marinactinospora thermotolerans DSM 45154]